MAFQLILDDLQSGKHDQIANDVKEYFGPVLNNICSNAGQRSSYGLSALKFLHTSVGIVSSGKVSKSLLDAIHTSYHSYTVTKTDIKQVDPLTIIKLLYHLVSKLLQKDYAEDFVLLTSYLHDELSTGSPSNNTTATIIQSTFSVVWNLSIEREKENLFAAAFNLRIQALKFLVLKKCPVKEVVDRLLLGLNRFYKFITSSKVTNQEDLNLILQHVKTVWSMLDENLTSLEENAAFSLLCLLAFLMKLKLKYGLSSETIGSLQKRIAGSKVTCLVVYSALEKVYSIQDLITAEQSISWGQEFNKFFSKPWKDKWYMLVRELFMGVLVYLGEQNVDPVVMCSCIEGVTVCVMSVLKSGSKPGCVDKGNVDLAQLALRTGYKLLQDVKRNDLLIATVLKLSGVYNALLESDSIEWTDKSHNQERHYCGYLMSKLGHMCCSEGNYKASIDYYTISCRQLRTWADSDASQVQQRLKEVSMWKMYECLAEGQLKILDLSGAMETIIECLLVDSSHMTSATKMWVKAKRELIKEGKIDIENKVLGLQVKLRCKDNNLDVLDLLMTELQCFKSLRNRQYAVELSILKAVLEVAKCPCVRARALLDIVQVSWLSRIPTDRSFSEYTTEAVALLSKVDNSESQMVLAELYLWQYIIDHEEACLKVAALTEQEIIENSKTITPDETGEESDTTHMKSEHTKALYTLTMELDNMSKLDKALGLWEVLLHQGVNDKVDHSALLSCFLLCASIFRLSRKMNQELRILQLAKKLTESCPDLDAASVNARVESMCLLKGDLPQTNAHSDSSDSICSTESLSQLEKKTRDAEIQSILLKAQRMLHQGEIEEGKVILSNLLEFLQSQAVKNTSICMAEGTAKRLMSMFQGLPAAHQDFSYYALNLAFDSVRMHSGVLRFMFGEDVIIGITKGTEGGKTLEIWMRMHEILMSVLHLGQMYTVVGEAREAKCYLKEGLKIAHYMCLPCWTSVFLKEISKVYCLSDSREDLVSSLQSLHHLYNGIAIETPHNGNNVKKNSTKTKQLCVKDEKSATSKNDNEENMVDVSSLMPPCFDHVTSQSPCDLCGNFWTALDVLNVANVICHSRILECNYDNLEEILMKVTSVCNSKFLSCLENKSDKNYSKTKIKKSTNHPNTCSNLQIKELYLESSNLLAMMALSQGEYSKCLTLSNQILDNRSFLGTSFKVCLMEAVLHQHQVQCQCEMLFVTSPAKDKKEKSEDVDITTDLPLIAAKKPVTKPSARKKICTNPVSQTTPCENKGSEFKDDISSDMSVNNECDKKETNVKLVSSIPQKTTKKSVTRPASRRKICDVQSTTNTVIEDESKENSVLFVNNDCVKKEATVAKKVTNIPQKTAKKPTGKSTARQRAVKTACDEQSEEPDDKGLKKGSTIGLNVYEFDEQDSPSLSKAKKSTRSNKIKPKTEIPTSTRRKNNADTAETVKSSVRRNNRSVRSKEVEKARTADEDRNNITFPASDVIVVKEDVTSPRNKLTDCEEITFPVELSDFYYENLDHFENKILIPEDTLHLDDSIEILRADDGGKKQGQGRRGKKTQPKTGDSKARETTEVLRSSQSVMFGSLQRQTQNIPSIAAVYCEGPASVDPTLTSTLEKAFHMVRHFPTCIHYNSICHLLSLQHLETSPLEAVFYLCEAMHVTFRHQALLNASKKLRKLKQQQQVSPASDGDATPYDGIVEKMSAMSMKEDDVSYLKRVQTGLSFNKTPDDLRSTIDQLPFGLAVCQITMVTHPKHPPVLLLSRLQKGLSPVVVRLAGFSTVQGQQILPEFTAILEESQQSMKLTEKTDWWKTRQQLDDRMCAVLNGIEKHWLGHWKVLLLGNPWWTKEDQDRFNKLTDEISSSIEDIIHTRPSAAKLQLLLQSLNQLTDQQLTTALAELTSHPKISLAVSQIKTIIKEKAGEELFGTEAKRQHVIVVLDKAVQHLPWENIPILRKCSVSRVPSFYHMSVQLSYLQSEESSVLRTGIDYRNTFYILNPDNNLPSTQDYFQSWFKKEDGWKGFVGVKPSPEQFKEALSQRDLLIYCGHGSGSRYFNGEDLQQINCHAAAILMGCSSGRLSVKGQLEPSGMMLNYFLARCPCVVANLWDVTDRDIDRFLKSLLSEWKSSNKPAFLRDVIPVARDACRLPYLIGAAPVVYGFPVFLKS